jgi:hypothetical protein
MLSPRLELFLDEAGNCAALSDLDVLATTARGQGIQSMGSDGRHSLNESTRPG